jgi:hypothetical protein
MPSSSQHPPSTGAMPGRLDGTLPVEHDQDPCTSLHQQPWVKVTHCAVFGQVSGGGSLHPPEELELLVVMPLELLEVALLVALSPPVPPAPPELPDPVCCSTTGPHATNAATIKGAALRVKRMIIIRGGYAIPLDGV